MAAQSSPRERFAGRAGVVTGAGKGLGRAVAGGFAAEGGQVVVVDIDDEAGERTSAEIADGGGRVVFQHGDVGLEGDVAAAVERCVDEFGRLDLVHNNAGIQGTSRFHETTTETWDLVQRINLTAVFWGCKYGVEAMRRQGNGGAIVNTASMLSFVGDPFLPAYTAAKTGVLGLTRAIAVDCGPERIRCNCVCPGDMDTPMNQEYFASLDDPEGERKMVEQQYPLRRFADPAEVAQTVLFLASDESSFVTGTAITVDGGLTAKPY